NQRTRDPRIVVTFTVIAVFKTFLTSFDTVLCTEYYRLILSQRCLANVNNINLPQKAREVGGGDPTEVAVKAIKRCRFRRRALRKTQTAKMSSTSKMRKTERQTNSGHKRELHAIRSQNELPNMNHLAFGKEEVCTCEACMRMEMCNQMRHWLGRLNSEDHWPKETPIEETHEPTEMTPSTEPASGVMTVEELRVAMVALIRTISITTLARSRDNDRLHYMGKTISTDPVDSDLHGGVGDNYILNIYGIGIIVLFHLRDFHFSDEFLDGELELDDDNDEEPVHDTSAHIPGELHRKSVAIAFWEYELYQELCDMGIDCIASKWVFTKAQVATNLSGSKDAATEYIVANQVSNTYGHECFKGCGSKGCGKLVQYCKNKNKDPTNLLEDLELDISDCSEDNAAVYQGTRMFMVKNVKLVEDCEEAEVVSCNKDTVGKTRLQKWSRGIFVIAS
ncbi:Hypothetical predicted protein, partial [Paramuricea clavata]